LITLSHSTPGLQVTLHSHTKGKSRLVSRGVAGAITVVSVPIVVVLIGVVLVALRSWIHFATS